MSGPLADQRDQAVLVVLAHVITLAILGGPEGYATISWRDGDSGLLLSVGASAPTSPDEDEEGTRVEEPLF